ncbi:uncharacterized protein EI90DRAFT_2374773 [Cantharellus anzutake]|uniref:uncharacterized protein n=1 Tax=Cantharellus anzutake TaxID=1750568 RepID=UPI0019085CA0|nr:uncharacterized protein EI90DRAFT_2374773 [Cantharellus anzutake]KAF8323610.1 hypothetical protein EI90DRAFT_2374773 [Cantharellus anzutake]
MVGAAMPPLAYNTKSNLLPIKRRIWVGNFFAFCIEAFFLIVSMMYFPEKIMAAILLALTPAWELSIGVYRYFRRKGQVRKEKRRRQKERKGRFREIAETVTRMNPNRPTECRRSSSALNFPPTHAGVHGCA